MTNRKHAFWFKFLYSSCICLILYNMTAQLNAQINTENLRRIDFEKGWTNTLALDLGYISGNSDFLRFSGNFRSDIKIGKYSGFGVLDYQHGQEAGKLFVHKGFLHLRILYPLSQRLGYESFIQKEFNEFIRLKDRNLLGVGARVRLAGTHQDDHSSAQVNAYAGIGAMWENERITTTPSTESSIIRSTNYITIKYTASELVRAGIVAYFQINPGDTEDYRILLDGSVGFQLATNLILETGINYRYDNQPPIGVESGDLEISNGLVITF